MQSIRHVALEKTGGHSALVKTLTTSELLSSAAEVRERAISAARSEERTLAAADIAEHERQRREGKVARIASAIAKTVMAILLSSAVLLVLWQAGIIGVTRAPGALVTTAVVLFGIYGAADLLGYASSGSLIGLIERVGAAAIRKLQAALA